MNSPLKYSVKLSSIKNQSQELVRTWVEYYHPTLATETLITKGRGSTFNAVSTTARETVSSGSPRNIITVKSLKCARCAFPCCPLSKYHRRCLGMDISMSPMEANIVGVSQ